MNHSCQEAIYVTNVDYLGNNFNYFKSMFGNSVSHRDCLELMILELHMRGAYAESEGKHILSKTVPGNNIPLYVLSFDETEMSFTIITDKGRTAGIKIGYKPYNYKFNNIFDSNEYITTSETFAKYFDCALKTLDCIAAEALTERTKQDAIMTYNMSTLRIKK